MFGGAGRRPRLMRYGGVGSGLRRMLIAVQQSDANRFPSANTSSREIQNSFAEQGQLGMLRVESTLIKIGKEGTFR